MAPRKPKPEISYRGTENEGSEGVRKIVATHNDRIVGYLASSLQGGSVGRKLDMAWTDPAFRRQGIAATMVNLEHHRTGHMPVGDQALSKGGAALQRGLGVPKNPKGEVVNDVIARSMEGVSHESITRVQPHLLTESTQFDSVLSRALTPVKPGTSRRAKPEQQQLFDTGPYTVPPARRDEMLGRSTPPTPKGTVKRQAGGKFASRKRKES